MKTFKTLFFAVVFGSLSGIMLAVMLGFFVPEFFNEWAGKLVCAGKLEYMTLKRTYFCYASPNEFYDLGDQMFWAVFKRFVFPSVMIGFLVFFGFIKLTERAFAKRNIEL
jgi:hypothetical protein